MAREQFQTLSEPMYYILLSLLEECCGVDIMEKVKEISGGRVSVGPGTVYTLLARFEENEMIHETKREGKKRWYVITQRGRVQLLNETLRLKQMLLDGKTGGLL